jgi:hypothetical protein
MKKIFWWMFLFSITTLCYCKDVNNTPSFSLIIKGCNQGSNQLCNLINNAKASIEATTKIVPQPLIAPAIMAYYLITDKGVKFKNTISNSDFVLIQQDKISFGVNLPF